MPSIFDQQFAASGFPQLKQLCGETVVYYLQTGGSRTISAIIERNPPAFYGAGGEVVQATFILRVDNNCDTGILASEVDTGGDMVELLYEIGDTVPQRRVVERLISQDSGVVVLGVR